LRLKTNRLQYRIEKLVEQGLLSSYTSIFNPESIGLNKIILAHIASSSQHSGGTGNPTVKFLEDLLEIILADFDEIMFASVGYDDLKKENILVMIFAFYDSDHQSSVIEAIKENPLVGVIETTELAISNISHRLFTITPALLNKRDTILRNKMIDDEKEHQRHAKEHENDQESDDSGEEDSEFESIERLEEDFDIEDIEDLEDYSAFIDENEEDKKEDDEDLEF